MRHGKSRFADVPRSEVSPLNYAVNTRDRDTLAMVAAALRHRDTMLAFQPVVQSQRPDRVAFYEGLIRVLDETGRIIPAREFIDAVEATETGRILDCVALETGLRTLRRNPDIRLAINMSARSIGFPRWTRSLKQGLQGDPTLGERLILEITERSAMTVPELVVRFMSDLQSRGITFALDDFGAGYTSLRYLRDFSFDMIKIDGEFIRGVHSDPDNQVLTRAMVDIAHQFDMFTVAESVEHLADSRWLTGIGVDCQQGYFFGAPTVQPPWNNPAAIQVRLDRTA
ncbi:EAL domain-containing protein [Seohaeicola saemankumensis]|uniref:EAL domain-containing protein n=1 Tax=Seohaeicola saemankumensis TaxID=481181 RepID=UPI001E58D692|nr:EAL domain-containing protein [Seohaeicola saemankumensis]MCD1626181.1 EAL domain-containing protein [Seohaeicola saemankumensis]